MSIRGLLSALALALVAVVPTTVERVAAADETNESRYALPEDFVVPAESEFDDADGLAARAIETLLGRGSTWDRNTARRTLSALGDHALPRVVAALRSGGRRERGRLMRVLAEMRTPIARSLLIAAAGDELWQVRRDAAYGLGQIPGEPAVDSLLARLDDSEWPVRAAAVGSLGRLMRRLEADTGLRVRAAIVGSLDDDDADVRRTARHTLVRMGAIEVIPSLIALGDSLNDAERDEALGHLWELRRRPGFGGEELAAFLRTRIRSDERARSLIAAAILARLEPAEVLAMPRVREDVSAAISSYGGDDTVWARRIVEQIGRPSLELLRETLEAASGIRRTRHPDVDRDNRTSARRVLDLIARVGGRETIPDFVAMIRDSDDEVLIRYALEIAADLFPAEIVPAVVERYDGSGNFRIKARLLRMLSRLAPEEATSRLAGAAVSGHFDLQFAVIDAVKRGDRIDDAESLTRAVIANAASFRVIERGAEMLVDLVGEEAESALVAALDTDDLQTRRVVAAALGRGRWRSEATSNALRATYDRSRPEEKKDDEEEAEDESTLALKRRVRAIALSGLQLKRRRTDLDFLARALRDPWPAVRVEAARLGRRTKTPEVAAALISALDGEEDDFVRDALVSVLATSPTDVAQERITAMIVGDSRDDLVRALSALASSDGPLPSGIVENLGTDGWDEDIVRRAARVVAQRGDPAELGVLADRLDGAPYETADAILAALSENGARHVVPQLLAQLPDGNVTSIDELDQDLMLILVITVGETGDARAIEPLRKLLAQALAAEPESTDREWLDEFAGEIATAFAKIAPDDALDDVVALTFDPDIAERAWADGVMQTRGFTHPIPHPVHRALDGLRRAKDVKIVEALDRILSTRRRSGELFALPASHLAGLRERLEEWRVSRRPRPRAVNRIAFEIMRHPPRASYEVLESALHLAHVSLARVEGANALAHARAGLDALRRDPERRFVGEARDRIESQLIAIERMAQGLVARSLEEGDTRCLDAFRGTIDARPRDADVACLVALYGQRAGLPPEHVAAWARRAYTLSSGESDRARHHILHHVGWIRHCHGDSVTAAVMLQRADADLVLDPWIPYRRAIVAMALDRPGHALDMLARAFAFNDTLMDHALTEEAFAPLREDGRLAEAIDEARAKAARNEREQGR